LRQLANDSQAVSDEEDFSVASRQVAEVKRALGYALGWEELIEA
jgi:hypothetical protein